MFDIRGSTNKIALLAAMFTLVLLFHSRGASSPEPSICHNYLYLAQKHGCSPSNYLYQFGYPYCELFLSAQNTFSTHAKLILSGIRACLLAELEGGEDWTCENVHALAMKSHIKCYQESQFCYMPVKDQVTLIWLVRGGVTDLNFLNVMFDIAAYCNPFDS